MISCPRCGIRFAPDVKGNVLDYQCFTELCDEGDYDGDYTTMLADYRAISNLYERKRSDEEWGRILDSPLFQELIVECMSRYDSGTVAKLGGKIAKRIKVGI